MAAFVKLTLQETNTYEFVNVDHVVRVARDPEAPNDRVILWLRRDVGYEDITVLEDLATVTQKMGL